MPDTLPSVEIVTDWYSVPELTGLPAGTPLIIQNQSRTSSLFAAISPTKPPMGFRGIIIPPKPEAPLIVDAGENTVWLRSPQTGHVMANIQEDA